MNASALVADEQLFARMRPWTWLLGTTFSATRMIEMLVLPRFGRLGASSQLRINQYLPYLREHGFNTTELPLLDDEALRAAAAGKAARGAVFMAYLRRLQQVRRGGKYDLIWAEQELLPWLPAGFELGLLGKVPLVLDCDDAVIVRYAEHRSPLVRKLLGRKVEAVIKRANLSMAGSRTLASRARDLGCERVELFPTVIDLSHHPIREYGEPPPILTLGWMGSPASAQYLAALTPVLTSLYTRYEFRSLAIGVQPGQLDSPFMTQPWSEVSPTSSLQSVDIGLMPTSDEPLAHGKCGYQLIEYMASGLPVIAVPTGRNREIVVPGINGFLASSAMEWESALQRLLPDPATRARMGREGRRRVESKFSLQGQAPRLAALLRSVVGEPKTAPERLGTVN